MAAIPRSEFPRPDRIRNDWLCLNGEWDFALFPAGQEAQEADFARARDCYPLRITVPFSWVCPLSGVARDEAGVGWYRRSVRFERPGRRIFLCFGAVDYRADVYVNGVHAGSHEGGYTPFALDVSGVWRPGENTVEVRAQDDRLSWQPYGKQGYGDIQGIWQSVWLEARPEAYLEDFRFLPHRDGRVELTARAHAPEGTVLTAAFAGRAWSAAVSGGTASLCLTLENPRLWSPDDPFLYEGTLTLGEDTVGTYFGVREIAAVRAPGRDFSHIALNGRPVYLNGVLDQAYHPLGHFTYPTDDDMREEAWRVKRLGLNMVRLHIKAEDPRRLYWLDKLGVLVMADIPCFWGPPEEKARAAYEGQWRAIFDRDFNHPSIFSWVMFNESWGLLDGKGDARVYTPQTQAWVRDIYRSARAHDPTRLIEDNSACRYDHVETDLNTWHFYLHGYETLRRHVREVVEKTFPGSDFNFIGGNRQNGAPLLNSECGMVWGVDGSAGDSDLAWQYHYMLNEFRLQEKLCGFVFTELHDVVNEFNGYYRIDNTDKDFGYQAFCRGMTLRDLHAPDMVAMDCPPCRTVRAGETAETPLVLSHLSASSLHGAHVRWELWHDGPDGRVLDGSGSVAVPDAGPGVTALETLRLRMPSENAVAVLSAYLTGRDGSVLSRNFTTFDVRAPLGESWLEVPVREGRAEGFFPVSTAMEGEKLCLGGSGRVRYDVRLPGGCAPDGLTLYMEAGARRVLSYHLHGQTPPVEGLSYMLGYQADRGAFANSCWMTDETRFPTEVEILVDDVCIGTRRLENDWADSRGVLSWHAQGERRRLEDAGSYGEQIVLPLPSRLVPGITARGGFTLTLRVAGPGGLSLYGRRCGRYAHGLLVRLS